MAWPRLFVPGLPLYMSGCVDRTWVIHNDASKMTRPEWQADLEENGYAVVRNVIPKQSCDDFVESSLKWLETFPHGFKRDDRSTWKTEHLPWGQK